MAAVSPLAHFAPQLHPLFVSRLALRSFRSYDAAEVESDGRAMVFWGPNGAGKTNLLEALSFLVPGRGLRSAKLGDAMQKSGGAVQPWAVAARLNLAGDDVAIRTGLDQAERREVFVDGTRAGTADLGGYLRLLWLTPAQDRLFTDSPGARRRFLDRMVLGLAPDHGQHAAAYEKAMRERQRLLNDEIDEPAWMTSLETAMAEAGAAICAARRQVVADLQGAGPGEGSLFPRAAIALQGREWSRDSLVEVLRASRGRDHAAGRATEGPHRADLVVRHADKDMAAADCSTGEQKALLIGLVLANARLQAQAHQGAAPVLLLDEVAAHLDEVRRAALFDEIEALGAQAWMTGTDEMLFDALGARAQHYQVSEGTFRLTKE